MKAQSVGTTTVTVSVGTGENTVSADVAVMVGEVQEEVRDLYTQTEAVSADAYGNGANNQTSCVGMDPDGSYVMFENVDFQDGAKRFTANYATGNTGRKGNLELRLDSLTGPVIGTVDCELTAAWGVQARSWIELDSAVVNGVHDLYLIANPGALNLHDIQFSQNDAGGSCYRNCHIRRGISERTAGWRGTVSVCGLQCG